MRARILFVESNPHLTGPIAAMLEMNQFEVVCHDDDRHAIERLATDHFDVMLIEVKPVAEDGGLRFLRHVNAEVPHLAPRIVVISTEPSAAVQRELDTIGICDLVLKPVHEVEILKAVEECLDRTSATVH